MFMADIIYASTNSREVANTTFPKQIFCVTKNNHISSLFTKIVWNGMCQSDFFVSLLPIKSLTFSIRIKQSIEDKQSIEVFRRQINIITDC